MITIFFNYNESRSDLLAADLQFFLLANNTSLFDEYPMRDRPDLDFLEETITISAIGTRVLCQIAQFTLHCQNTGIANRATTPPETG